MFIRYHRLRGEPEMVKIKNLGYIVIQGVKKSDSSKFRIHNNLETSRLVDDFQILFHLLYVEYNCQCSKTKYDECF